MKKLVISLTIVYLQCLFLLAANQNNLSGNGFNKPDWPLEVLSWDIDKAYLGIEYNYRLGVKGGEYPYNFTLVDGPTGMTIDKNTGEILWTPASLLTDDVVIKISDISGKSLVHRFAITSTTKGFYFVDSAKGNNSNDGSEEYPWLTMKYASATADSASYVYVKKGTYNEAISLKANNCGRFFAYPGDSVIVIGTGTGNSSFGVGGQNRIFQGFTFDGNGLRWLFSVGGYAKNLIWRKNIMHNNGSSDSENPAFIFFWNGSGNPIAGQGGYNNVVIQDNIFYDLNDPVSYHCASVTGYDVQNMLYEDNIAHDIDGNGVDDKDMGYMNTFRNNVIYNCLIGIGLLSQGGNSGIEVNYNHIYNCEDEAILVGLQAGDVNNIFIHHNTFKGLVRMYEYVIAREGSTNINIYKNIIGNGSNFPYVFEPSGDANYPKGFRTKVLIDSNIVFGKSDLTNIAGETWGIYKLNWKQWQDSGKDVHSIPMQLQFDSDNIPILPDSLKIYGHFGSDYNNKITDVILSENENPYRKEYSLSQNYPNPFNPSTTIKYTISESPLSGGVRGGFVTLKVYNILGQEVATLVNAQQSAGNYTVQWSGTNSAGQKVCSGVYFYQLKTGSGFIETKKMLLIR